MTIFVMSDIELPQDKAGPKTKYPFEDMAVGQTFFLPNRKASKFAPYAGKFARRTSRRFQVRDVTMTPVTDASGNQIGWKIAKPGDVNTSTGCAVQRLPDAAEGSKSEPVVEGAAKDATGTEKQTDAKVPAAAVKAPAHASAAGSKSAPAKAK